jgi:hypothetical protein
MLNYVGAGGRAYLKGLSQNLCGGLKKSMEKCGGRAASGSRIATHECVAYPVIAIGRLYVIFGRCNSFHFIRRKSKNEVNNFVTILDQYQAFNLGCSKFRFFFVALTYVLRFMKMITLLYARWHSG